MVGGGMSTKVRFDMLRYNHVSTGYITKVCVTITTTITTLIKRINVIIKYYTILL